MTLAHPWLMATSITPFELANQRVRALARKQLEMAEQAGHSPLRERYPDLALPRGGTVHVVNRGDLSGEPTPAQRGIYREYVPPFLGPVFRETNPNNLALGDGGTWAPDRNPPAAEADPATGRMYDFSGSRTPRGRPGRSQGSR